MRNLKKLLAVVSVAAIAMSFATSAFAADYEINGIKDATVEYANGTVTLEDLGLEADKQYTVVMFEVDPAQTPVTRDANGAPILDDTKIIDDATQNADAASNLLYVNQGDKDATFWDMLMPKGSALDAGLYLIRIGGEDLAKPLEIVLEITTNVTAENGVVTFEYAAWADGEKPLANKKVVLGEAEGTISKDSKLVITCGDVSKEYSNLAEMLNLGGDVTLDAENVTFGVLLDSDSELTGFEFNIQ